MSDQLALDRVDLLLAEHDPSTTPAREFLGAQFDAGLAWVEEGDRTARREFFLIANELIDQGRHEDVVSAAQMLMGLTPPMDVVAELSALSLSAQSRQPFRPPG